MVFMSLLVFNCLVVGYEPIVYVCRLVTVGLWVVVLLAMLFTRMLVLVVFA